MNIEFAGIEQIRPADTAYRAAEYRTRVEEDDEPQGDQKDYYAPGHRVYVRFVNTDGDDVIVDATEDHVTAAIDGLAAPVNAAIIDQKDAAQPGLWRHSRHAGCGMCGCSPGFIVTPATITITTTGPNAELDVWVKATVIS